MVGLVWDMVWNLEWLKGFESLLIYQSFLSKGQWANNTNVLADLGEAAQTLKNLVQGDKVVHLLEVELERLRQLLAPLLECFWLTLHVLEIDGEPKVTAV